MGILTKFNYGFKPMFNKICDKIKSNIVWFVVINSLILWCGMLTGIILVIR